MEKFVTNHGNTSKYQQVVIRQGSVTRIANEREEQQLMQLANKIPYDDRLCHAAQVDDLSPLLVKDYLRRVGSRITMAEAEAIPFEQLCWNMQIVGGTTEAVHPKNVGVLFFCDNPELFIPCAHIEIVKFGDDVSSVFKELDLTEGRNTGFPKIYSSLRKNGSPMPLFETDETNSFFRATLPIHKAFVGADSQIKGHIEPLNEPLNEPLKGIVLQVYQLIVAQPGIKKVEIADSVKKSYASAKRYVKVLEDYHLVEYRDSKKTGGLYPVKK